ncbi:hypothetical protein B0I35DRAFT_401109 [Stachybotrys elegans]|uniref:Heterokaryon incompatibility domain-containing protein n=1 Tax=Stachybotrys elegans TaxID=80388 RepID=A0A8K0WJR2_9HYPO|nr:hypothetical protein B0I35DRAFT_401109 [Stachybotrys elegans]
MPRRGSHSPGALIEDSAMPEMDDKGSSLSRIARQQNDSIVSLLIDIVRNTEKTHNRVWSFLENLECLRLPQHLGGQEFCAKVNREMVDARQFRRYVALSYTWEPSKHEPSSDKFYHVQEPRDQQHKPSEVRDCVLNRIFNYMRSIGVDLLWIDRHCIVQDRKGCEDPVCRRHEWCIQKREGLAVMDQVYKLSDYPVGLLGRPIKSAWELSLLANILLGRFTEGDGDRLYLSRKKSWQQVCVAVDLLRRITSDDWWTRGWIFQENYRGGTNMKLLIKHPAKLEHQKRRYLKEDERNPSGIPVFGEVDGELCIRSIDFHEQATRLCLACQQCSGRYRGRSTPAAMARMSRTITRILHRAGKYTLLLKSSEPLTPRIVADIDRRQMHKHWDKPDIIANCCGYATRLNTEQLKTRKVSLSLSILAQCLLNGEVLHNGRQPDPKAADLTVPQYLQRAVFASFYSKTIRQSLTFNKSCRFFRPTLTEAGIRTSGHLWKLCKTIDTSGWPDGGMWVDDLDGKLQPIQRRRLAYFVEVLEEEGHRDLATTFSTYLSKDARRANIPYGCLSFTERYMLTMAGELDRAIERGDQLILGSLWNLHSSYSPYMAVFIWKDRSAKSFTRGSYGISDSFAFTASCPEKSSDEFDLNDLDRHVSFEVDIDGPVQDHNELVPKLKIRRWLPGLCFFEGEGRDKAFFPWPSDLTRIIP